MLTHAQIWNALDRLAARAGLSASGLAKRAGLDPTTFNKSKRITPEGRARWPSTESVAKSLAATGTNIDTFVQLIEDSGRPARQAVPLIGFAEAGAGGYFDDGGFPAGKGWDEIPFPAVNDENAYALEISGSSMEPAYRDGAVIIVSPARLGAQERPRGGEDAGGRGDGEGTQAQDREVNRAAFDQSCAHRPLAADARRPVDRPHRLGEPVGFSRASCARTATRRG